MVEALLLLLAALMIFLCGIFVAAEFSLVAVSRSEVRREARRGSPGSKKLLGMLGMLSTHLSSAQIGITATNLLLGFLAEPTLSRLLAGPLSVFGSSSNEVAFLIAFGVANFFTIVFGEMVPKNLAISKPLATARAVAPFQNAFSRVIFPLLAAMQKLSNRILLRFGIEPQEELASARSAEELSALVRRSAEEGTLEMPTARLLDQALQFRRRNAEDAMTPRSQAVSLAPGDTLEDLVEKSKATGFSRFPLMSDQEIHGVVHLRQAIAFSPDSRDVPLEDFAEEPLLVPSSFPLHQLLPLLRGGRMQIALVVDEFGSFDGLLTLEDLVEEMIGELHDEHDREDVPLRSINKDSWELSGRLRPDEIFRLTGVQLPEGENWETVAGLLLYHLQAVPSGKEKVVLRAEDSEQQDLAVELVVNRMDGLRIDRVHMRVTK